jgi:Tfp pilus assembly protein FimT
MVVMVIMVLLAGLAAPRFVGSMRSERLRTGGRVVLSMVQLARSRAASEGRLTRLDFDYDQGRITALRYVQDTQGESDSRQEAREPTWEAMTDNLGQARDLPLGITIRYVGEDLTMTETRRLSELVFRPDGSADSAYVVLEGFDSEVLVVEVDDIRFMPRVLDVSRPEDLDRIEQSMRSRR